jgi:predicted regulator of Ras-like GTPase activity (Roadblock/LC7/MglB family)
VFERILRELVAVTPGAIGSILLDQEGESIQFWADRPFEIGADGLRAIGAYQGIYLAELNRITKRIEAGKPERFTIDFEHVRMLTSALKEGYYLVLITDASANEGVAWHHLRSCCLRLLVEL